MINRGLRPKVDVSQGSLAKRILFAHRCRPFAKLVIGPQEAGSQMLNLQMRAASRLVSVEEGIDLSARACAAP
ncbi:MAG: hypothetical protein C5B49_15885 [Bdellovibrio sp.]|nr:MAG: hypothetical protein C5B49_15885 [Bdellovibrio sp.]